MTIQEEVIKVLKHINATSGSTIEEIKKVLNNNGFKVSIKRLETLLKDKKSFIGRTDQNGVKYFSLPEIGSKKYFDQDLLPQTPVKGRQKKQVSFKDPEPVEKLYCTCQKPWNESDLDNPMIECTSCKDWFHRKCLKLSEKKFNKVKKEKFLCGGCKKEEKKKVYCICKKPFKENDGPMICCNKCSEWFHQSCLGLKDSEFQKLKKRTYVCINCNEEKVTEKVETKRGRPQKNMNIDEIKQGEELHCLCRKPFRPPWDSEMVQCETCNIWYHQECISMTDEEFEKVMNDHYYCKNCEGNKQIPQKKRGRVPKQVTEEPIVEEIKEEKEKRKRGRPSKKKEEIKEIKEEKKPQLGKKEPRKVLRDLLNKTEEEQEESEDDEEKDQDFEEESPKKPLRTSRKRKSKRITKSRKKKKVESEDEEEEVEEEEIKEDEEEKEDKEVKEKNETPKKSEKKNKNNCKVCEKTTKLPMICCDECNSWYHQKCMNMSDIDFNSYQETDLEFACKKCNHSKECYICKKDSIRDDDKHLLKCQSCQLWAHYDCLELKEKYEHYLFKEDYYCSSCLNTECSICKKTYTSDKKDMIECNKCKKWYHIDCINMSIRTYKKYNDSDEHYECYPCKGEPIPEKRKNLRKSSYKLGSSEDIDRSKRVAPGGEISSKHITDETRVEYSKNIMEERSKQAQIVEEKKGKEIKEKKENKFIEKKLEEMKETEKEEKIEKKILSDKVMKEVYRLEGKQKISASRSYLTNEEPIPESIQHFIDIEFKESIQCPKYKIDDFEFISEFDITEKNDYPFLKQHNDYILFGWGANHMICARQFDKNQDLSNFNIYILSDDKKAKGPIQLSDFLKECK